MNREEKIEQVLKLIDNTQEYSEQQIQEMLSDKETREIYDTIVALRQTTDSNADTETDVEEEWRKITEETDKPQEEYKEVSMPRMWRKIAAAIIVLAALAGISYAMISNRQSKTEVQEQQEQQSVTEQQQIAEVPTSDTIQSAMAKTEVFENVSLEKILDAIAAHNNLKVVFYNEKARSLRLFYEWTNTDDINKIIGTLNGFDTFDLSLAGDSIIVE